MSAPLLTYSALINEYHKLFFHFCQARITWSKLKVFVNYVLQQLSAAASALSAGCAVDQNAVLPYHLDVAPVDDAVVLSPQQTEKPRPAVDDDRHKPSVAGVHLHIADISQPHAVLDVDDLFVPQIHNPTIHTNTPNRRSLSLA